MAPKSKPRNWKEFLLNHPNRQDYDDQAEGIQSLIDANETPLNNFRVLAENKPLVCMTKSPIGKFIQLTFFHSFKKTTILKSNAEYFALSGFDERASAV